MITQINPWILQGLDTELPNPYSMSQAGLIFFARNTDATFILVIDPVTQVHSWHPMGGGGGGTGFPLTADGDANGFKILNLANPTNPQDAATKSYVDAGDAATLAAAEAYTDAAAAFTAGAGLSLAAKVFSIQNPNTDPVDWAATQTFSSGMVTLRGVDFGGGALGSVIQGSDGGPGQTGTTIFLIPGAGASERDAGDWVVDGNVGGPASATAPGGRGTFVEHFGGVGGAGSAAQPAGMGGDVVSQAGNGGADGGGGGAMGGANIIDGALGTSGQPNGAVHIGRDYSDVVWIGEKPTATSLNIGNTNGLYELFINQGGVPLHGSNSGIQYSSLFASRAQFRGNQYGANTGVPGISTFKSRGLTVGSLAPVVDGDVLFRATAVGVTGNLSIPLAGFISLTVPVGGAPAAQGWVATEFAIQLVPLAGPINSRREVFKVTSEGALAMRETPGGAGSPLAAGIATTGVGGTIAVANTAVKAGTRVTATIQPGGAVPTAAVYVASITAGVGFTLQSFAAGDVGVNVYWQLWEAL